ncbi:MAG: HupE/UreJ family protein [Pseudomonadota bacterium]
MTMLLKFSRKLRALALVSTLLAVMCGLAQAHEVRPSIADLSIEGADVRLNITLNAEAMIARIDQSRYSDTNAAPEVGEYDALRALPAATLAERFRGAWPGLSGGLTVTSGSGVVSLTLSDVTVIEEADPELPRDTRIVLEGTVRTSGEDDAITVMWSAAFGSLVLRQTGEGEGLYTGYLEDGVSSEPIPLAGGLTESVGAVIVRYLIAGFDHIIPKGLDHILFVLGLFFFALKLGPLLWQVTAFTAAHTITLALASVGWVQIPGSIVEPLIAASIVYVAVENILRPKLGWWRPALVFAFGLLHGLGFASVLGEFGIDPSRFTVALVAFNVGVEIGQLAVIAVALALVALGQMAARATGYPDPEVAPGADDSFYRAVSIMGSLLIAGMGAWWVIERTLL